MITLKKWLSGSWERARQHLIDDLESIETGFNSKWSAVFTKDNKLKGSIALSNLPSSTQPAVLLGRESGTAGEFEEITPAAGLVIKATSLELVPGEFAGKLPLAIPDSSSDSLWSTPVSNGLIISGFTQGSVIFAGLSGELVEDNASFFWDDANNQLKLVSSAVAQAIFSGWTNPGSSGNASVENGEIVLGNTAAFQGRIRYDGHGSGHMFIDNSWDDATADIYIRTRTAGTAVNGLVIRGNGRVGVGVVAPSTRMEVKQTDNTDTSPTFRVSRTSSGGDFLPIAAFGDGTSGDLTFNKDSSGTDAFTTWAVWSLTNDRWEAQATTTVGATQQIFSTDGSIAFNTQPSAAVTAGDALTFNPTLKLLGNGDTNVGGKFAIYKGVATAGWGVPAIYSETGATGQTGDVASVATYTVGAADGDFYISCNVNVTAFTAGTQSVQCTYTDETNTARTLSLTVSSITGTFGLTVGATGAYEGVPLHIRAKASTVITIKTVGTVWTGTYNVRGAIIQIA